MDQIVVVHLLRVDDVTVVFLTEVLWVDPVGSQELLISHAERLPNGLGYELGLGEWGEWGGGATHYRGDYLKGA